MIEDPQRIGTLDHEGEPERVFRRALTFTGREDTAPPRILEIGTRRYEPDRPTHHRDWCPKGDWCFTDLQPGTDVDVVDDAHDLNMFQTQTFDGVIAVSVLEHLARPWRAAEAIARVLRRGGWVYVNTHHSFPEHAYPDDYWRFSTSALGVLFGPPYFANLRTGYQFPCVIQPGPEVTRWNPSAPAWLNVEACAQRTDAEWAY